MDKEQRSIAAAEKRVNRAMAALRAVGNLSGPGYRLTRDHWQQMWATLQEELDAQGARFTAQMEFSFREGLADGPGRSGGDGEDPAAL